MDALFFAFANQSDRFLPTLQEEDDGLHRLLAPRAKAQHFLLHRDSFITSDKLASYLTLYRDQLLLFLFSGHAGRDELLLHEGTAYANGLARLLGQCPQLKLVFLNGCSTAGQVACLLEQGVAVVIATSAPVNDRTATTFSLRFFEALQQQFTLREAFATAKAALEMENRTLRIDEYRGADFRETDALAPMWGLFYHERHEHVLDWKLPAQTVTAGEAATFIPNHSLIQILFAALSGYSPEVQRIQQQERSGIATSLPKKRMAVLNALPAPLAEPLRKLLVPVENENEGFDKVSEARLRQIAQAYHTSMELLGFTMLAQLWEAFDVQHRVILQPAQQEVLKTFFRQSRVQREAFDFLDLIQTLRAVFDHNNIHYFVEELQTLCTQIENDAALAESLLFLYALRLQMAQRSVDAAAIGYLCQRAEENLAHLYSRLAFMARYRLATIQGIDVLKYRHRQTPHFNHATVMLHDLLGGFDISEVRLEKSLDNRSILLLNEDTWEYLNLSPFVIDENAFQDRTDLCKLFFFSHYAKAADTYFFKYVNKPGDPLLEISAQKYPLVQEQLEAFAELLWQQPMRNL